jgi:hypothetical protein
MGLSYGCSNALIKLRCGGARVLLHPYIRLIKSRDIAAIKQCPSNSLQPLSPSIVLGCNCNFVSDFIALTFPTHAPYQEYFHRAEPVVMESTIWVKSTITFDTNDLNKREGI